MKKILLIGTGGTIASGRTEEGLKPILTAEDILSFVPDLDENLIREAKASIRLSDRRLNAGRTDGLLKEGDRVRHRIFGPGTIRGVDPDKSAYIIRFDDLDTDRQITFRAKLEKMD